MNKFSKQLTVKNLLILMIVIILPFVFIASYNFIQKLSKEKDIELARKMEKQILDSISKVKIYDTLKYVGGLNNCVLTTKFFENQMKFTFDADIVDPINVIPGPVQFPSFPSNSASITLNFYDKDNFLLFDEELFLNLDFTYKANYRGNKMGVVLNSYIADVSKEAYLRIHHWDFSWSY
jgi:hypothetical protein